MTPRLFHGPSARDEAVRLADETGRQVSDPVGDGGLKVEDARSIVELAISPGVGSKIPVVVVGPIDEATPEAADALLKTLEEITRSPLRIVLWANNISGVVGTVKSRSIPVWCPPGRVYIDPLGPWEKQARDLAAGVIGKDPIRILNAFEDLKADECPFLIQALCVQLASSLGGPSDQRIIESWARVRAVLSGRGSIQTAVDAVLPREL